MDSSSGLLQSVLMSWVMYNRTRMAMNKWLLQVSFIFGVAFLLFVSFGNPEYGIRITEEDGPIEDLTALFYLFGVVVGFIAIFRSGNRYFAILWTLLCFVFLGEETSWFQRVLDYSVPAVEEMNSQGEFNFHNLKIFQGEELFVDGKLNKVGLIDYIFSTQNVFRIGFFGYFLILPLLSLHSKGARVLSIVGYVRPGTLFICIMLLVIGTSFALAINSPTAVKSALAETREMFYAYFILIYLVLYFRSSNGDSIGEYRG